MMTMQNSNETQPVITYRMILVDGKKGTPYLIRTRLKQTGSGHTHIASPVSALLELPPVGVAVVVPLPPSFPGSGSVTLSHLRVAMRNPVCTVLPFTALMMAVEDSLSLVALKK